MEPSQNPLYKPISAKRILKAITIIVIAATVISYWYEWVSYYGDVSWNDEIASVSEASDDKPCNIAGVVIRDFMDIYPENNASADKEASKNASISITASDDVSYILKMAASDERIKGALIEIDSTGGVPVAGEEIANALKNFDKPTVAVIRQTGTSAAYLAATGADMIFASANSDVGSIGVTQSYLENTGKNTKDGLIYQELHSGKYKDMLNPDKPLTADERALVERDLAIVYENFIKAVSENRKLAIDAVRKLADGSSMTGAMALLGHGQIQTTMRYAHLLPSVHRETISILEPRKE